MLKTGDQSPTLKSDGKLRKNSHIANTSYDESPEKQASLSKTPHLADSTSRPVTYILLKEEAL
ncbi:hypothetical protein PORUE0001_0452 [Porphyromonas uenonis 60-3]|uniref:Uncharacterized protein n=1 Tax=Porphyromonas uenonis 60-3 TaxID=596327 RepID=C2M9F7_9PORP|nr:hypothetical protein PORUE0001_0452 [Porphyromonas uenonis 60-3]